MAHGGLHKLQEHLENARAWQTSAESRSLKAKVKARPREFPPSVVKALRAAVMVRPANVVKYVTLMPPQVFSLQKNIQLGELGTEAIFKKEFPKHVSFQQSLASHHTEKAWQLAALTAENYFRHALQRSIIGGSTGHQDVLCNVNFKAPSEVTRSPDITWDFAAFAGTCLQNQTLSFLRHDILRSRGKYSGF